MSLIDPIERLLLNLEKEVDPCYPFLHMSQDAAVEQLKQITGQDYGFDARKWRQWLANNNYPRYGGGKWLPDSLTGTTNSGVFGGVMVTSTQREVNQAAYRRLKDTIAKTYPKGQYVAIFEGNIIADAATFRELDALLHERGYHSPEVLVVQAGVEYPEYMMILGTGLFA